MPQDVAAMLGVEGRFDVRGEVGRRSGLKLLLAGVDAEVVLERQSGRQMHTVGPAKSVGMRHLKGFPEDLRRQPHPKEQFTILFERSLHLSQTRAVDCAPRALPRRGGVHFDEAYGTTTQRPIHPEQVVYPVRPRLGEMPLDPCARVEIIERHRRSAISSSDAGMPGQWTGFTLRNGWACGSEGPGAG